MDYITELLGNINITELTTKLTDFLAELNIQELLNKLIEAITGLIAK